MNTPACETCEGEGRIMRDIRQSFDQPVSCPCPECYNPYLPRTLADEMADEVVKQARFPKFQRCREQTP